MTDVVNLYHELETSPVANWIGAEVPEDFYNMCEARIHCDASGNACALELSYCLGDHCWSKTIDLDPIIKAVHHGLVAYHKRLHGDVAVSGWASNIYSRAKKVATSVAKSKAAKSLWKNVSPYVKDELIKLPGGKAAYQLALKASRALEDARDGNPKAVAAIKQLAVKAQTNSDAAKLLETTRAMHYMLDAKAAKGGVPEIGKRGGAYSKMIRKAKAKASSKRHAAEVKRSMKSRAPTPLPPRVREQAPPQETEETPYDEPSDDYDDYDQEASEDDIAGFRQWMYSKPYRSSVSAFPGAGLTLRTMYLDGLQTIVNR